LHDYPPIPGGVLFNRKDTKSAKRELISALSFSDSPGVRPSSGAALQEVRTAADRCDALRVSRVAAPEDGRTPPWLRHGCSLRFISARAKCGCGAALGHPWL